MARITNPATIDLFCAALGRIIPAGATVAVVDEVAAKVAGTVFRVERDVVNAAKSAAEHLAGQAKPSATGRQPAVSSPEPATTTAPPTE